MTDSPVAQQDEDGDAVRLVDLLASATYTTAVAVDLQDDGSLYVRNWRGYIGLRLNRHRAICWHRRLPKRQLQRIAERAIDAGGDVRVGNVEDLLPRRYRDVPEHLHPEHTE